jgi:hypothetical protein
VQTLEELRERMGSPRRLARPTSSFADEAEDQAMAAEAGER